MKITIVEIKKTKNPFRLFWSINHWKVKLLINGKCLELWGWAGLYTPTFGNLWYDIINIKTDLGYYLSTRLLGLIIRDNICPTYYNGCSFVFDDSPPSQEDGVFCKVKHPQ